MEKFSAKVHFVAGKGGVGKSLVAKALAQMFAKNHKTLLIELSEEEAGEEKPKLAIIKPHATKRFSQVKIYPDQTLYEYLTLKIPQKRILDSFFSQTLFRALSSAMPGLADLTRLGKIWFHADEEQEPKGELYEKIVVDMPSSGFVGRFLTIARVVSEAVKIGPLAKEAKLIHQYFANADHARLHVVTLLQEIVVNETIELVHEIERAQGLHIGHVIVNRVCQAEFDDGIVVGSEIAKVLDFFRCRLRAEQMEQARLAKGINNVAPVVIPDFIGEEDEEKIIASMATIFERGEKL